MLTTHFSYGYVESEQNRYAAALTFSTDGNVQIVVNHVVAQ